MGAPLRLLQGRLACSIRAYSVHPVAPARTRFAPSPTGFLHLGSLRTALYNYLLAKSTKGQFLLRLEDTDRTRLVANAEQNIYDSLKWVGLEPDEGPLNGGPYGPYRQSERKETYRKYAEILLETGHAYKCFCSKDRLADLRNSAMRLKPPTNVTYDRHCLWGQETPEGSDHSHGDYTIRFKSPDRYPPFQDLLHGNIDLQPQFNTHDRRYDDFVIVKLDGMPTYHFANVVDDHLMQITHVVRGEEWLLSTPKHIALYAAFGWQPPQFVHIPLLTSLKDKKLSKRQGDMGILTLRDEGVLPEALVNFTALFGWSPSRETGVATSEVMDLAEIVDKFLLDNLTRGNAKVSDSKLAYFGKHHLGRLVANPKRLQETSESLLPSFQEQFGDQVTPELIQNALLAAGSSLTKIQDLSSVHLYLFRSPQYHKPADPAKMLAILQSVRRHILNSIIPVDQVVQSMPGLVKKDVFQAIRFAVSGGIPGLTIPGIVDIIGQAEFHRRLDASITYVESCK